MGTEETAKPSQAELIGSEDVERWVQKLARDRAAVGEGYRMTSEEDFIKPLDVVDETGKPETASQRVYLEHEISYIQARLALFMDPVELSDPSALGRDELLKIYDLQTVQLSHVFEDSANWAKKVKAPYGDLQSGAALLTDLRVHEANHVGMNRVMLNALGYHITPAVLPLGR